MNYLISFAFVLLLGSLGFASSPTKLVARTGEDWQQPVYDPSGSYLAFTNASQTEIWIYDRKTQATRRVVHAINPGRRYCFEPGQTRLLFRHASMADPSRSERVISTDIWQYDPVPRTTNLGAANGPYVINEKIWYRTALTGPLLDVENQPRSAAPYLDLATGSAWIVNSLGDTVFRSPSGERVAGMEISPDGQRVAFVTSLPQVNLLIVTVEDGKLARVNKAGNPGWSGDSRTVAYVTFGDDGRANSVRLWQVAEAKSVSVPLPVNSYPSDPALNLDASRVSYVSHGEIYEFPLTP